MRIMSYNGTHQYQLGAFIMTKELSQDTMQYFKIGKGKPKTALTKFLKNIYTQFKDQSNLLFFAIEDTHELERIESFVRLVRHRIKDLENNEMERLVEIAMPEINLQQPDEILDQAKQNADIRTNFLETHKTLDAEGVHIFCGSTASNKAALAGNWRKKGKIFGVEYKNRLLYPVFQFDITTGKHKPVIESIIKALGPNMGPWQTAMWFATPNTSLKRHRPVDLIDKDPKSVVNAAKQLLEDNLF